MLKFKNFKKYNGKENIDYGNFLYQDLEYICYYSPYYCSIFINGIFFYLDKGKWEIVAHEIINFNQFCDSHHIKSNKFWKVYSPTLTRVYEKCKKEYDLEKG